MAKTTFSGATFYGIECLSTTDINKLLGFKVSPKFLMETCRLYPMVEQMGVFYWRCDMFRSICQAIGFHVNNLKDITDKLIAEGIENGK